MGQSAPGLLRHSLLGTDSVYRVSRVEGALVELEVVRVPGLQPGTRVQVTRAAARSMRTLPARASSGTTLGVPRKWGRLFGRSATARL
jgi:hypothetical protein